MNHRLDKHENYQDFYVTDLIFKKNKIEARCNCPLKEEWCKHSVAVALKAIDEHAYEDWLETKFGMQFDFPDENGNFKQTHFARLFSLRQFLKKNQK